MAQPPFAHGIRLSLCSVTTDFGQGFYTTTNLHQAQQWANQRCRRLLGPRGSLPIATVLSFEIDRDQLSGLNHLAFVTEGPDYYDFVAYSRYGYSPHGPYRGPYDVVYGPVSLWPQSLVIKDCDQISFHTPTGLALLPRPGMHSQGNPLF